jgi:hypothetical protein
MSKASNAYNLALSPYAGEVSRSRSGVTMGEVFFKDTAPIGPPASAVWPLPPHAGEGQRRRGR